MSLWSVHVLGDTLDPGQQLDFEPNHLAAGIPAPGVAAGDTLHLDYMTGSRDGGTIVDPDPNAGEMKLDDGTRYCIRRAQPTDNVQRLGSYQAPVQYWFVVALINTADAA